MLDGLGLFASSPELLLWVALAAPIGLFFGVVPGLGGKIAIITIMPFVFSMDATAGAVFLISVHAVVHTGGAVPAILFGIPGTGPSTAVVADGHALTQAGDGTRAISASVAASVIGGIIGAIMLAALIPVSLTLVRNLSYPEIFFLSLFGISLAALLSGGAIVKGLITGCLGLFVSYVGHDDVFGVERYTLGLDALWDGIGLVVAILAVFAIPEMLAMSGVQRPVSRIKASTGAKDQLFQGFRDVYRRMGLTIRCSGIGAFIGIVPGLGGDVAAWLCYGHAAQSSPTPERFGKGAIEGVIGPEAANNSKEGGALVPTLFLGLPGSSGMAILLVALAPLGIVPGPGLVETHPQIPWLMVWALVLSNVIAGAVLLVLIGMRQRFRLGSFEGYLPYVFLFALLSVYLSTHAWPFFLVFAVFSFVGVLFKALNWPRAPFVIGIVLGPVSEEALVKSIGIWGADFALRPVSIGLLVFLLLSLFTLSRRLVRHTKSLRGR